jgi:hypothetical protein
MTIQISLSSEFDIEKGTQQIENKSQISKGYLSRDMPNQIEKLGKVYPSAALPMRFYDDLFRLNKDFKDILDLKNVITESKYREAFERFETETKNLRECLLRLANVGIADHNS